MATVIKSQYLISKMDCPSEVSLIRMQLAPIADIVDLQFDVPNRTLWVTHQALLPSDAKGSQAALQASAMPITQALAGLNLGSQWQQADVLATQAKTEAFASPTTGDGLAADQQRQLLWWVLAINASFFMLELVVGWLANSMGVVADSLDMLADSLVYGMSLIVVGAAAVQQRRVAHYAGWLQLILAILGFAEVIRRFLQHDILPSPWLMIGVSILALIGNATCLYLLQRASHKAYGQTNDRADQPAHLTASLIFTSNDIIVNLGVIVAALLVAWFGSPLPDLLVGALVFIVVLRGAVRILALGKS